MKLTIELTPKQLDELAEIVAGKLATSQNVEALTLTQAAKRLGVSKDTVNRRVKAGVLPVIEGIGAIRISSSHIDRLMGLTPTE